MQQNAYQAKRGRRDKPEGAQFRARDNHGTDRTPDQPSVHTDSSRGTESKSVQENIDDLSKKMLDFEDTIQKMELSIEYQKNQSRRCILQFDGCSEVDGKTWEQTEKNVRRAMTTALELPEAQLHAINIERAHRTAARGREPGLSSSSSNHTRTATWCYSRRRRIGLEASM